MLYIGLRVLRVIVGLTIFTTGVAHAADFKFPEHSFGQLLLVPNQTTGGNDALITAQKGGAFEPISEFNADDRYRQFGAPIARLDMLLEDGSGERYVSTCTANLIAVDILLTNYHCIPGMEKDVKVIRSIAVFDYLREDQDDAPSYEVDVTPIAASYDKDFALLRVQDNPGDRFGYFELKPHRAKANQSLFIIHHPAGMPKRLTRFRCKAYAPEPYAKVYFRHRCDTLGGSSGSLIFNLNFEVVALHNQGGLTQDSQSSFNRGISVFSLMEHEDFSALLSKSAGTDTIQQVPPKPAVQAAGHNPLPLSASAQCDAVGSGRICASSMLTPQGSGKYNYRMRNLASNDGAAWVENKPDYGIGEWVLFDFGTEKTVSKIIFNNGYTRNTKTFSNNSRVAQITVELSTGTRFQIGLIDTAGVQNVSLPGPETVTWAKLTIDDVIEGRKYSDTALSYVNFR